MTDNHDPKRCHLCARGRHPTLAAQTAKLAEHLKKNPLPKQRGAS